MFQEQRSASVRVKLLSVTLRCWNPHFKWWGVGLCQLQWIAVHSILPIVLFSSPWVHAQLTPYSENFWRPGYLGGPLSDEVPRFNPEKYFPFGRNKGKGLHEQASHYRRLQRIYSPRDCSHSYGHVWTYTRQFGTLRPVVHGRRGATTFSALCDGIQSHKDWGMYI
jgi:hypothetical protein